MTVIVMADGSDSSGFGDRISEAGSVSGDDYDDDDDDDDDDDEVMVMMTVDVMVFLCVVGESVDSAFAGVADSGGIGGEIRCWKKRSISQDRLG